MTAHVTTRCRHNNPDCSSCGGGNCDGEKWSTGGLCGRCARFESELTLKAYVGDHPSIAQSPAASPSDAPELPARQTSLCDEVLGDTQTSPELPIRISPSKYRVIMTVTGSWTDAGEPRKRVIRFRADESECGDLLTLLFDIERAINDSAGAYSFRANVTVEES